MPHLTLVRSSPDDSFIPPARDWCRRCGAQDDGTFRIGGDVGVPVEDTDDIGYLQCDPCSEQVLDSDFAAYQRIPWYWPNAPCGLDRAGFAAWFNTLPADDGGY